MADSYPGELFSLRDKVVVVTGGGGVLCGAMSRALGKAGARVAILDLQIEAANKVAGEIQAVGGQSLAVACDVLDRASLQAAARSVLEAFGQVDILICGAGGNKPQATTNPQQSFFDLDPDAIRWVFDLNFTGTLLASQVFGKLMVERGQGVILNISSMNAFRPLTRIPAYSGAKASVSNFTQWLAVHMAQEYSPDIRVNAIAPGFFVGQQNRHFLLDEKGDLTPRGKQIIDHTPMGRFGEPQDLMGTMFWLLSPASQFVTGVVVPVDGGFSAYSGV
jgi:NAD(P)-dependent dehydrogenase (short-subunit alcohol dehydrogenase family)